MIRIEDDEFAPFGPQKLYRQNPVQLLELGGYGALRRHRLYGMGGGSGMAVVSEAKVELTNGLLRALQISAMSQQGVAVGETADYTELSGAVQRVLELLHQVEGNEVSRAIDMLTLCPTLDSEQLEQARRHAADRRSLMARLSLLPASEFARLMPQAMAEGSNVARALGRWVQAHKLLAVRIGGDWHYPVIQINPHTGEPYPELQPVFEKAQLQGYTPWEVLGWLTRAQTPADTTPGESPLHEGEHLSPQALVEAIEAQAPAPELIQAAPIDWLLLGQTEQFKRLAAVWLGA